MSTSTKKRSRDRISKNPVLHGTNMAAYISDRRPIPLPPHLAYGNSSTSSTECNPEDPDVQINTVTREKGSDSDSDGDFIPSSEMVAEERDVAILDDADETPVKRPRKQRKLNPNLLIKREAEAPRINYRPPSFPSLSLPPPLPPSPGQSDALVGTPEPLAYIATNPAPTVPVPITPTAATATGSRLMTDEQVISVSIEKFDEFVRDLGELDYVESRVVSAQRRRIYNRVCATKSRASTKERLLAMEQRLATLITNVDSALVMLLTQSQKIDMLISATNPPL